MRYTGPMETVFVLERGYYDQTEEIEAFVNFAVAENFLKETHPGAERVVAGWASQDPTIVDFWWPKGTGHKVNWARITERNVRR